MEKPVHVVLNLPESKDGKVSHSRRQYIAPKLINYGGIAELVQMNGGTGPDGGPIPPITFS